MSGRTLSTIARDADQIRADTRDASRHLVRLAEETKHISEGVLVELDKQGKTIGRIEGHLVTINGNLQTAEKTMTSMEKFLGLIPLKWRGKVEKTKQYRAAFEEPKGIKGSREDKGSKLGQGATQFEQEGLATRQKHSRISDTIDEDIDSDLDVVNSCLRDLRAHAITIGEELDDQTKRLDRVGHQTTFTQGRLHNVTVRVTAKLSSA